MLERRRRALGDDHRSMMTSMNNLAVALIETGALDEADSLLTEARELQGPVLGPEHPETLRTLGNLGVSACSRGGSRTPRVFSRR